MLTNKVEATIYASEAAEDIDVRCSFGWATITSEDGASLFLCEDDVQALLMACGNDEDGTVDVEDPKDGDCITLELEQLNELVDLF